MGVFLATYFCLDRNSRIATHGRSPLALLTPQQRESLHPAIRKRFSNERPRTYEGEAWLHANPAGRLMAWLCILIGRPLPTSRGHLQARIQLKPGRAGMTWMRDYIRTDGAVEHVRSTKRIAADNRLLECARLVAMRLFLSVEGGALVFTSDAFLLDLGCRQLRLPDWLTPGHIRVVHRALDDHRFEFHLTSDHAWFGRVFDQRVVCTDPKEG